MNILSKFVHMGLLFISISLLYGPSCQKDENIKSEYEQVEISKIQDRTGNTCPCEITIGCEGPQVLSMEIIERVGIANFNIYLSRVCSGQNNESLCLTWNNPSQGATIETNVKSALGPPQFPAGGGFVPHYKLESLFYFPYPSGSYVKIKLIGPGINQTLTITSSSSVTLYPWTGPCP